MATRSIKMATLGMFIIDDIEYTGSQARQESVIGGAGTYAAIGARIVSGRGHSGSIGWIVDAGSDFPVEFRQRIEAWGTSCLFREDGRRLTTRAWNGYGPDEHRAFRYLTPKIRLDENSLSEQLLQAQAFHLVCSAERCIALVQGIMGRRTENAKEKGSRSSRPFFIWEPMPDLCTTEHLGSFKEAIQQVDVVSPNSEEFAGFFLEESRSQAQRAAEVLGWGVGPSNNGLLVIREGKNGCSSYSKEHQVHLAAYHTPDEESQSKVADPTGGGNAFLGALAMTLSGDVCPSLAEAKRLLALHDDSTPGPMLDSILSLVYATVAASFVIEQPGMANYCVQSNGAESWNGEAFGDRLKTYLSREKANLTKQMK